MKVEDTKSLKIKLKGEDADNFKSAIKKLFSETEKPGFKNQILSTEESEVIKKLNSEINK